MVTDDKDLPHKPQNAEQELYLGCFNRFQSSLGEGKSPPEVDISYEQSN
jgi:hypothetical protein